jgi:hypothetical protein
LDEEERIEEELEDEFAGDLDEEIEEPEEGERVLSKSFKQGFAFGLGIFFAVAVILLLLASLTYLAFLGGLITEGDLYYVSGEISLYLSGIFESTIDPCTCS